MLGASHSPIVRVIPVLIGACLFTVTADLDLDPDLPDRKLFDKAAIGSGTSRTGGNIRGRSLGGVFILKGRVLR